jgi:8-oxo-dGTP pyrophosphatase MutT (NUDIX family)
MLYIEVLAAGCVVENQRGELLWMERNGKWDLPKGKVEPGESLEEAAMREVEEETGISQLSIASDLGATYHTYDDAGTPVLKTTFWFHAKHSGDRTKGQPQKEEGITAVSWHAQPISSQVLSRAYPSLVGLLDKLLVSG